MGGGEKSGCLKVLRGGSITKHQKHRENSYKKTPLLDDIHHAYKDKGNRTVAVLLCDTPRLLRVFFFARRRWH
jgi:hypothetical protein